jgi:hypothetical protein
LLLHHPELQRLHLLLQRGLPQHVLHIQDAQALLQRASVLPLRLLLSGDVAG